VQLAVPGFEPAVLALPEVAVGAQPVLVAAHGAGGEAHWHCELWRKLTGNRGYILCPQGVRIYADRSLPSGYYFPDHHHLEREVMAAVKALWAHCPRAARSGLVYAGYSQGATMGALMLVDHADVFSRLVLIEGGTSEWNIPRAAKFRRGGGQRVLFACGVAHCERGARRSARWLEQADVATRVEYARGAGHTPGGVVAVRLAESFAWLVQGDERWSGG
jgi:predicted esterase